MRLNRNWLGASAAIAVMALAAQASAQSGPGDVDPARTDPDTEVDEIIVTAQRRAERAMDVPISLTAYSGQDLEDRNITDLAGLQAVTPGLEVSPSAGGGAQIAVRGISTDVGGVGVDPSVGVYIDGVYVARDWVALQGYLDVNRVEILRGPQGTLYGRNTTGGAYNLYRNAPSETWTGSVAAQFASFNRQRYEAILSGPIVSDRVLFRAAVASENADEYGDNLFTDRKLKASDSLQGLAALEFRVTDDITVTLRADAMEDDGRVGAVYHLIEPGTMNAAADIPRDPYEYRSDFPAEGNYLKNKGWSAHVDWDLGDLTFRSITGGREIEINTEYDSDFSELPVYTAVLFDDSKAFSQEFQLLSPEGGKFEWIVGAHYYTEDANDLTTSGGPSIETFAGVLYELVGGAYVAIPTQIPFENRSVFDSANETRSMALFGQASWQFTDKLSATLGLRYTDEKRTFDGFVRRQYSASDLGFDSAAYCTNLIATNAVAFPFTPADQQSTCVGWVDSLVDFRLNQLDVQVGRSQQELNFDDLSPRFVIDYYPNPDTHLYASATRGFKSGGFNSYDTNTIIIDANGDGFVTAEDAGDIPFQDPFDPERLWSYEVGAKGRLWDGMVQYALGAFYYDWSNIQVQITDFIDRTSYITNDSQAWARGVELDLVAYPWDGGVIDFHGAWLDSEYTDFGLNSGVVVDPAEDRTGQPLRGTPERKWSFGVQHTFAILGGGDVTPRIEWLHRSNSFHPNPDYRGGEYDVVNARLSWRDPQDRFSASVYVENLTDEEYEYYGFGNDLTGIVGIMAPPRTFGVRLSASY